MNHAQIKETFNSLVAEGSQGFTLDHDGREYREKEGYAVAYKTCASLAEALEKAGGGQYVGWWVCPETGRRFIEVVDIFNNFVGAVITGVARNQTAIYDYKRDCLIDITGFYKNLLLETNDEGQQGCKNCTS